MKIELTGSIISGSYVVKCSSMQHMFTGFVYDLVIVRTNFTCGDN